MQAKVTLKGIRAGDSFTIPSSAFGNTKTYVALTDAQMCGRGYVRLDTSFGVVNLHGSTPIVIVTKSN